LRRGYTYRHIEGAHMRATPKSDAGGLQHGRRVNDLAFENETRAGLLGEQDLINLEKLHAMDLSSL